MKSKEGTVFELGALSLALWSGQLGIDTTLKVAIQRGHCLSSELSTKSSGVASLGVVTLPQRGNPTRALFALIGAIHIELWRAQLGADTPPRSCHLKRALLELGALNIKLCNGRLGVDTSPQRCSLMRALFALGALNI